MSEKKLSTEEAEFIQGKTDQYFEFVTDCYDECRKEGNVLVNWYFAVIVGGLGSVGPLFLNDYWFLIGAPAIPAVIATIEVRKLLESLRTNVVSPPGNFAKNLRDNLEDDQTVDLAHLVYREALGVDSRIRNNLAVMHRLADAVDHAKLKFADLPKYFAIGAGLAIPFGAAHCLFAWLIAN